MRWTLSKFFSQFQLYSIEATGSLMRNPDPSFFPPSSKVQFDLGLERCGKEDVNIKKQLLLLARIADYANTPMILKRRSIHFYHFSSEKKAELRKILLKHNPKFNISEFDKGFLKNRSEVEKKSLLQKAFAGE
ncbi:MAG: hypothetical protein A3F12_07770 [Gammaproteobacteria bacterium RIFCSPHIGHO2_12_FULL_38_14]|nr:MAG: hypothetical protein A3F12_07770 [Gammaproteobacteria bacterium RIFCSPHIGHO2_12_FULL_38_14]